MDKEIHRVEFTREEALKFVAEFYSTYAALRASCTKAVRDDVSHAERVASILAKWLVSDA